MKMKKLYNEDGKEAGLFDVIGWFLHHYEGMEHLAEGGLVAPEYWYTITSILRRCLDKFSEKEISK